MNCPLCESVANTIPSFIFPSYQIYTCRECAARFTQPFIDNAACYDQEGISGKKLYLNTVCLDAMSYDKLRPLLKIKNKRILDIGCATGTFLETVQKDNSVMGVEISEDYRTVLESKGIPHLIGDLYHTLASLPDGHFDLITLWDVFEHLQDPPSAIRAIKQKLSPDGKIIIWTNNYDDCISFSASLIYNCSVGLIKTPMSMSFNRPGGHNYNFVAKSLDRIWQKNGLCTISFGITDTPSEKLSDNFFFKLLLNLFYAMNRLLGKGKIIYYVVQNKAG